MSKIHSPISIVRLRRVVVLRLSPASRIDQVRSLRFRRRYLWSPQCSPVLYASRNLCARALAYQFTSRQRLFYLTLRLYTFVKLPPHGRTDAPPRPPYRPKQCLSRTCHARKVRLALNPHARRASCPRRGSTMTAGWPCPPPWPGSAYTGDQLELELSDEPSSYARGARGRRRRQAPELPVATAEPTAPAPPPAAAAAPIVKRGPGRPRKTALPVIPPTLKARGGKRKAAASSG